MKNIALLYQYTKKYKGLVFICSIFALLSIGSKLLIPFLAGRIINLLKNNPTSKMIHIYLIICFVALFIGLIFRYLFDLTTSIIGNKITKSLRDSLMDKYLHCDINFIDTHETGDLLSRIIVDTDHVQTGLISGVAAIFDGVVSILFIIGFMFALNYILAILVIILSPLSVITGKYLSKSNSKFFKKNAIDNASLISFANETISNTKTIATFNLTNKRFIDYQKLNENNRNTIYKANMSASTINPLTRLINGIINIFVVLLGAILIIKKVPLPLTFSIGELTSFVAYTNTFTEPFNNLASVAGELSYAFTSLKRIDEILKMDILKDDGKEKLEDIFSVEFKNVSFKYPSSEKMILEDLNIKINKGEKIAIVGPTGCGKTTIINLLMKFYRQDKGEILINNTSIDQYDKEDYYNQIGLVLQDISLFPQTVYENIIYGNKNVTKEEVINVCKACHAHEFISKLENGYDTYIDSSSSLSIGQKQLICIARVMLKNSKLIILDEATSNVDVRREKILNETFYHLLNGKTAIVIAHRLSTIISSDRIIVLKDGKIIEVGNHKSLLEKKGFYFELYNSQFQ